MGESVLPARGMPVFSNDGSHLGHVAEVNAESGWFKVDAPQAPDYWLPLEVIQDSGPRHVLLRLRKTELRSRRWEGPEPEPPAISAIGTDRDFRAADASQPHEGSHA